MNTELADIYVRLSSEDRDKKRLTDESESIQNQKTMLVNYCIEKGWQINGIYSDEDYSGADASRPAWNRVLKDCEEGRCTVVVCKTQSRFSRDMEMIERYIHGKFPEWGVRFVGVVDNADTSVKGNKKARQINGLVNEWYLEDLSENIKSTLDAKRKNGEFVGSFAPYGYQIDRENKNHLVIDEIAAPVVKRIFEMYIHGFGYIHIAKALNDENIPSPCEHKKMLGSKYYNSNYEKSTAPKCWSDSAVYAILRRLEYTGALVQGRQEVVNYKTGTRRKKPESQWDIVENAHEPLISGETFSKVQALRLSRGKGQKIPSGSCHALAKKVFCGECGNTMWKMSYRLQDGRYAYLSCKTRKKADGRCDNAHSIRLDELEQVVTDEINKLLRKYYDEEQIGLPKVSEAENSRESFRIAQMQSLERRAKRNDARIAQMYTDKLDGVITAEEFATFRERFQSENREIEKQQTLLKEQMIIRSDASSSDTAIRKKYARIDALTFDIADAFIARVFIGKLSPNGKREIRIEWKI